MSREKHITEDEFSNLLQKRMDEYYKILIYNGSSSFIMHVKIAQRFNVEKVIKQSKSENLFESEFWGYGINNICDGNESQSSIDVSDFRKLPDLNKHHNVQRLLWLLTFNIKEEYLFVNLYCIDTADHGVNSNLNTKYELKDFDNARMRVRKDAIFVDFIFKNVEKPIHFQIDTFAQGGKLYAQELAKYYISFITQKAKEIKQSLQDNNNKITDEKLIESDVDSTEHKLRKKFVDVLITETGKENFKDILGGNHKSDLIRRIKQHIDKHPSEKFDDYQCLSEAIDFSDIDHLKQSILKDKNWEYFEPTFRKKIDVEKYFNQLSNLRHTLKHSRKLSKLVKLEGLAALDWFEQTLK